MKSINKLKKFLDIQLQESENTTGINKWLKMKNSQRDSKKTNQTVQQKNPQSHLTNPKQAMRQSTIKQKLKQQQKQSTINYMQTILEYSIIQLQHLKNRQLINLKTNIGKLKYFVDFMRYKLYLDFNDDGKGPKIESEQAISRVCKQLEKLSPVYFHLIVDRLVGDKFEPYDPLLLKLRPSPYENHSYFLNFHDLQALDKIEPQPAIDTIQFFIKQVRRVVFLEPKRQKMQQDARRKWEEFRQIQNDSKISPQQKFFKRFTQFPSESQCYTEEDLQQALYTIDDLEIDFEGYEREEEQEEVQQNKNVDNIRQFMQGSFCKFYELQEQMMQHDQNQQETEIFW